MKRLKKLLSSTLACAIMLSCVLPLGATAAKSFTDVKGHWAAEQIKSAVSRGYVAGYQNGSFKPNASVTRAEFCKMLNNAMGLTNSTPVSFTDVSSNDWFYSEVCKSVSAGYISGYDDGSFRANDKITRQEAAVVISRIVSEPGSEKSLSDLRDGNLIAAWAQGGAKTVFAKGYMQGDNQKKFNPSGNLTRGEAVKIVESILGGEKISNSTVSISANQTVSNTVYTGGVSVNSSGNVTFQSCRILGTLQVSGEGTVRLADTKVTNLSVSTSTGKAEVIASGKTDIQNSSLSVGASLTESGISGEGFRKVELSGAKLSAQTATLSGAFQMVTVSSRANLNLRAGSISLLKLQSNASGSKIDLASNTNVERAELSGDGEFTGRGNIYLAVLNSAGSTFETQPLKIEEKTSFTATISPKNGATDVAPTDSIQLTFSETPYTSSRGALTRDYVEDSVIELRQSKASGTKQSFTASLSSSNRVITIKPDKLESNTKYFVIVKSALKNSSGQSNDAMNYSFTTSSGQVATVYPANGADSIPVNTPISITFPESIYQQNRSSLSSSYLESSVIELRSGSASGRLVALSASISSDRKTIKVTPDRSLETSTKYYLIVKDGSISYASSDALSAQTYSFSTASTDILVPAMNPSPGSTGVAVNTELELSFDSTIYNSSGSTVTSNYLKDSVFTLRRGSASGTTTPVTARIDSARKVVTLSPDSELRYDTTYYLIMDSRSLCDSSSSGRNYNEKLILSFSTKVEGSRLTLEPTPSPKTGATGVSTGSTITLSFDTALYQSNSAKSTVTSSYLEDSVLELRSGSATGTKKGFSASINSSKKVITIDPDAALSTNIKYYVIVKDSSLQNSSGEKNSQYTTYFTCGNTAGNLVPTVTPADGATGVAPKPTISINFDDDLYDTSNTSLANDSTSRNYVQKYAVQLRQGSESGSIVSFAVNSISSNSNISLTPVDALTNGNTYFLILLDGQLRNSAGQSNKRQIFRFTVGSGLTVSTSPKAGATGFDRTFPISLYFSDALRDASSGTQLTNANVNTYLKSYVSLTASGVSAPSFNLEISNDAKTITVRPTAPLEANRTYTLSLSANRVMNYSGNKNSSISLSFTTSATVLQPIVSPTNGSSIPTKPTISLSFAETLYTPYGAPLNNADVQNVIELHEGSSGGTPVTFDASVSGGKIITVTPTKELANSTRYYVILKGDTLASSSAPTVKNVAQTFNFTTVAPSYLTAPTVSISAVKSDGKQDITLSFATELSADKTPLDPAYLLGKLKLSTDTAGATVVAVESAHVSDKTITLTTITLTTPTCLTPGSDYYISAAAGAFSDASGNKNQEINASCKSPELDLGLTVENITKTTATIQVSYNYPVQLTLVMDDKIIYGPFTPNKLGPISFPLDTLLEGSTHVVKLQCSDPRLTKPLEEIFTFQTDITSKNSFLATLDVKDSISTLPISLTEPVSATTVDLGRVNVTLTTGDSTVTIIPTSKAPTITVNGTTVSSGADFTVTVSGVTTVTIVVTAEDNSTTTYTLTLEPVAVTPTN